ncbi:MAG TPA: amidohydrolase family protein [Terriglobales bacterium]|nr:amidohydrolase family protein [Terriglobales bacterium]
MLICSILFVAGAAVMMSDDAKRKPALADGKEKTPAPDVIFVNGDIYPGARFVANGRGGLRGESVGPRAQAMAVRDGRIVAVGTTAEISKLKGKDTEVVDLGGRFVMPGFNDAHLHLANGGFEQLNVNLVGTKSLDEMLQRIAARAAQTNPGEWVVGRGWDETKWTAPQLPTRQDLDKVTGDHPAFFGRVDGHSIVANTAALKLAGVTRETPDPMGGKIVRDAQGEATGVMRDTAENLVTRAQGTLASGATRQGVSSPGAPSQRRKAAELALADAARWGVTSAQDNSAWEDFLVYEDLEREGKLTLRISEWLPFDAPLATLQAHRAHHAATDALLHTGMLKGFMDGSLGSHSAAMLAPYADEPKNAGLPRYEATRLNTMAEERSLAGFQLGFHAIGDRGAQMALDAFGVAQRAAQARDFRNRIEHAQVTTPAQFRQFHELNVIASMQPCHLLTDMNWAVARLGPERARTSYAWRSLLDHGVWLAFGTDYPVEPITPFRGIYAALTRKNEAGTKEYFPEQRLTIEEAIAGYTTGAAYAQFAEREKGTLEKGKLADFVVLDRDLVKAAPAEILGTQVLRTVVGGKTVYEAR